MNSNDALDVRKQRVTGPRMAMETCKGTPAPVTTMKWLLITKPRGHFRDSDPSETAGIVIESMLAPHSLELNEIRHRQSLAKIPIPHTRHLPKHLQLKISLRYILYNLDHFQSTE